MTRTALSRPSPALCLGAVLALAACSAEPPAEAPPETLEEATGLMAGGDGEVTPGVVGEDGEIRTTVISDDPGGAMPAAAAAGGEVDGGTVLFAYDSDELDAAGRELALAAAARLLEAPALRARLEGHTDERGTRAYNLALGERRARSVRAVLLEQGVLAEQIELVSFGEELPLAEGAGEDAWRRNRRVEIVFGQ